jgi:ClpP class serine protease
MDKAMARSKEPILEVGVVYLMGTIGEAGEFDAASVVKGLRQAGEDDDIGCVVLRIDSGGGGVVDSDSIDQAVRDLREKKGKVVIASFSNSAASGGYLSACHA